MKVKVTYTHIQNYMPTGESGRKRLGSTLIPTQFSNYASLLLRLHQVYVTTQRTVARKETHVQNLHFHCIISRHHRRCKFYAEKHRQSNYKIFCYRTLVSFFSSVDTEHYVPASVTCHSSNSRLRGNCCWLSSFLQLCHFLCEWHSVAYTRKHLV
jgi:hypothetical protein